MKNLFIISFLVSSLFLFGCKKEPSSVDQELQVDAIVEQQAAFGWQANQIIKTGNEIADVTRESDLLNDVDIEIPGGIHALKKNALRLFEDAKMKLPSMSGLYKPTLDSLVSVDTNHVGVKRYLYYDSQTDIARYYEVRTVFLLRPNTRYDSTEVKFIANGTIFNIFDDTLKSLHNTQKFKDYFFIQSIIGDLIITDYTSDDITGAELTQDTYYHSNRYLYHLKRFADFNPDKSGTFREDFEYRDGKSAYHRITYNGDYTGSFAKQFRDGTQVSGTFDSVEDDLHGFWTELIQFPSGRYLDKIEREAEVEIVLPDSVFEASFFEAIHFSSGDIDTSEIDIVVSEDNDEKTTVLSIRKKNDAHGTFTIVETENQSTLTGDWTTWNLYYIELEAEFYIDGSGHVHYEVWTTYQSNQNGDPPILVVDYYFSPDGDGSGKLTYDGKTYDITAEESGKGTISKDGKSKDFNLIQ